MRKVQLLSALFLCVITFFLSCKKTGELTPSFSEGDLNAAYTDTNTVQSVTLRDDSTRTDQTSRNLFGILNDPVFGLTRASFYTQFQLSTTQLAFPSGTQIDSVVLKLGYDDFYGTPQLTKISAFELTEDMSLDDHHYNYSNKGFKSLPLGSKDFLPNLSDTVDGNSTEATPYVRITLDKALGDNILNHGVFQNNNDFMSFFKGLYIAPDTTVVLASGEGTIINFNLLSSTTALVFYYQYPGEDGSVQTGEYKVAPGSGTVRFSHYEHFYQGTEVELNMGKNDVLLNYVQPMSGVKTKITFPHIRNMTQNRNIAINKADLLITVAEGSNDVFDTPDRLILLTQDESGTDVFTPDFYEGTDYFGGKYDVNTNTYRFNIARYIDQLANEKKVDRGLYLIVSGSAVNPQRLVLNSGANPTTKLKLRLTFTQL